MHVIFGITALVMLAGTIWMLAKDHNREWRDWQLDDRSRERWTVEAQFRQAEADSTAELSRLRQELQAAQSSPFDDEMIQLGLSRKRARDIGHLPQSGPGGMLEWLDRLPLGTRKVLIHVNNTNPILDEDSAERATLGEHGIEVAFDGMSIEL